MMRLLEFLFGCHHKHLSFPQSAKPGSGRRIPAATHTGMYLVCLDCGKEFGYDWDEMKVLQASGKGLRSTVPLMNTDDY